MIAHSCPKCDKQLRLRDDLAGKKIKCPDCGKVLTIPEPDEDEAPPRKSPPPKAKRPRDEEDDEPPPRKKRPRDEDEDDAEEDEDEEDDEDDRRGKKKKKGDGPGKPSILLMIAGMALAIGGLIAMSAFIVFAKWAGDEADNKESNISSLKQEADQAEKRLTAPQMTEASKKHFEGQVKKYADARADIDNNYRPKVKRNILVAVLFGVIFLIGVGVRGYHHFAMRRWYNDHHGVGKKSKKKRRRDEDEDDDDD